MQREENPRSWCVSVLGLLLQITKNWGVGIEQQKDRPLHPARGPRQTAVGALAHQPGGTSTC